MGRLPPDAGQWSWFAPDFFSRSCPCRGCSQAASAWLVQSAIRSVGAGVIGSALASGAQQAAAKRNLAYASGVRNFGNADFAEAHASFARALALHQDDDDRNRVERCRTAHQEQSKSSIGSFRHHSDTLSIAMQASSTGR